MTQSFALQVYVRVRPFNAREKDAQAQSVIRMENDTAWLMDAKGHEVKFKYTSCFYSADPEAENYARQKDVYDTVGTVILDNVFEGYNACLLAYGQTGVARVACMPCGGHDCNRNQHL